MEHLLAELPFLRERLKNDRAILSALHFYNDDRRVVEQVAALENKDFRMFLKHVVESGRSSWMLCQNCYSHKAIPEQGVSLALLAPLYIATGLFLRRFGLHRRSYTYALGPSSSKFALWVYSFWIFVCDDVEHPFIRESMGAHGILCGRLFYL